ncbi:hypothetical protein EYF80_057998 [Liparis tanakae]|uniref:Uncharacterized protein n=1 Tax=Liparis tanakae TaxID=230148 RepID=A0A4Z2EST2_9TELE|nr:hypothetical protein EYF80_057998 [Liparis tanakae]
MLRCKGAKKPDLFLRHRPHDESMLFDAFQSGHKPNGAAVRSLPGVQPLVGLQAVGVHQRLAAVAAEEASARVGEHVAAQVRLLGEALVALAARKRLHAAVRPHEAVDAQRGPAGEGFAAELAAVGFLPAVQHQVLLQVALQAVGLLAVRAGERALAALEHRYRRSRTSGSHERAAAPSSAPSGPEIFTGDSAAASAASAAAAASSVGRSPPAARRAVNAPRFRRQAGAAADRGRLGDAIETLETPETPETLETLETLETPETIGTLETRCFFSISGEGAEPLGAVDARPSPTAFVH